MLCPKKNKCVYCANHRRLNSIRVRVYKKRFCVRKSLQGSIQKTAIQDRASD